MSVKFNKDRNVWTFRYKYNRKAYNGTCHGCASYRDALNFETTHKASVMRLEKQNTLADLFNNCADMLAEKNPIELGRAFDLAMEKPRKRKSITPSKLEEKRNYWNDFCAYMRSKNPNSETIQKTTHQMAEAYIAIIRRHGSFLNYIGGFSTQLAPFTLNAKHNTVREVFELLKEDAGIPKNPFANIPSLINKSESHEPFSVDEIHLIFQKANEFLHPLFAIGLFTGLSMGDICTLRKNNIEFERHFIIRNRNKTEVRCSIPMTKKFEEYMLELYQKTPPSEPYLLPDHYAAYKRNKSTVSNRATRFLTDIGIITAENVNGLTRKVNKKGLHSLRHTFCTIAGIIGIPESVVRSIVGHMTKEMIYLYTRKISEEEKLKYIDIFGTRVNGIIDGNSPASEIKEVSTREAIINSVAGISKQREMLHRLVQRMRPEDVAYHLGLAVQDFENFKKTAIHTTDKLYIKENEDFFEEMLKKRDKKLKKLGLLTSEGIVDADVVAPDENNNLETEKTICLDSINETQSKETPC